MLFYRAATVSGLSKNEIKNVRNMNQERSEIVRMDKKEINLDFIAEQIRGQIKGLNTALIMVWGIGFDNDKTALMLRRNLCKMIDELETMLKQYYDAKASQELIKTKSQ